MGSLGAGYVVVTATLVLVRVHCARMNITGELGRTFGPVYVGSEFSVTVGEPAGHVAWPGAIGEYHDVLLDRLQALILYPEKDRRLRSPASSHKLPTAASTAGSTPRETWVSQFERSISTRNQRVRQCSFDNVERARLSSLAMALQSSCASEIRDASVIRR